MQIGNNGTRTYEYNTAQRPKDDNSYSSFVVDTKSVKENATLLTKNLIKFIDKSGGFSSLSKEDEELFRAILEDDEISTSEAKNLSYEQMAKLNQLFKNLDSGTFFIKGFDIFHKANISNDENFNKSLFETLKNIENESDRTLFSLNIKSDLGYNKIRLPFEKSIEDEIAERITFEKEKYKDFPNKDEILTNIIQELKNWKIYDYGSFIDKTLFQLKKDISNPNTSEDGKYYLLKKLPYYEDLKTNYNKVINEPKYA
ncbi:hypothetical protein EI285_04075 [Aliarcobacter skirrowii]|uniref:hypothetical protein n=1 Tax=Aliarcobacter skirrowii TaxID=28200 RepID=UPI000F67EF40|nr:hypothetical protein [Aliarcobacter skirrowii]AZL53799.1 hypothetical protein EI285_04075 [Aliarcobacter skirrowii]